jgi:hypothetical protein
MQLKYEQKLAGGEVMFWQQLKLYPHGFPFTAQDGVGVSAGAADGAGPV